MKRFFRIIGIAFCGMAFIIYTSMIFIEDPSFRSTFIALDIIMVFFLFLLLRKKPLKGNTSTEDFSMPNFSSTIDDQNAVSAKCDTSEPAPPTPLDQELFLEKLDQDSRNLSNELYHDLQMEIHSFNPKAVSSTVMDTSPLTSVEKGFLKKIATQPVESPSVAGYWFYDYGLVFSAIMAKLLGNGYLEISTVVSHIDYLTVRELKEILRKANLPVSGKKAELITRIYENIPKDKLPNYVLDQKSRYVLTSKGQSEVLHLPRSITKNLEMEDACLSAIIVSDFSTAYQIICEFESGKRFPRGLNTDWSNNAQRGLSTEDLTLYQHILKDISGRERPYRAGAILCHMLGHSVDAHELRILMSRLVAEVDEPIIEATKFAFEKYNSQLQIDCYKALGVTKYKILGADDDGVCEICRKKNRRTYAVSNAKIGVTFPPFCSCCRCTTVPKLD